MSSPVRWSSKTSFIFAAAAAAIGLGNVWRFSYMTGQNGGGAFVLLYLLCIVVLALPLLISEIVLGRVGRKNPIALLKEFAQSAGHSERWSWLGILMVAAGFLIVTYYVVIVGWVLDYFFRSVQGHLHYTSQAMAAKNFSLLQKNHWMMLVTDTLVVVGGCMIIVMGIKKGLERAVMIIFPALLVLLLMLLVYAMSTGYFSKGLTYLFYPDLTKITSKTVLMALGQAFFSLNVAMGITMMFSAYLPEGVSIIEGAIGIVVADTGFALLSGMIIFPIVFAFHLSPAVGPALIFQTLPLAFAHMSGGVWVASLFFLMLFLAAFSSVIALLEPTVCCLIECAKFSRLKAVVLAGGVCWVLSLGTIGSFSLPHWFSVNHVSFFTAIDYLTSNIMLPLGGILLAVFAGWRVNANQMADLLRLSVDGLLFRCFHFSLRWVAPIVISLILLSAVGLL